MLSNTYLGDYIYFQTSARVNRNGFPNPTPLISSILAQILLAFYLLTFSQLGSLSSTTDAKTCEACAVFVAVGQSLPNPSLNPDSSPFRGNIRFRFGGSSRWLTYGYNKLYLSVLAGFNSTTTTKGSM